TAATGRLKSRAVATNQRIGGTWFPHSRGGHVMRRLLVTLGILAILPFLSVHAGLGAPDEKEAKKDEKQAAKKAPAAKSRIAVSRLAGPVTESDDEDLFSFDSPRAVTLKDLVARLKKAAADPEVKAVVFLPEGGSIGLAQAEEVRQAMK